MSRRVRYKSEIEAQTCQKNPPTLFVKDICRVGWFGPRTTITADFSTSYPDRSNHLDIFPDCNSQRAVLPLSSPRCSEGPSGNASIIAPIPLAALSVASSWLWPLTGTRHPDESANDPNCLHVNRSRHSGWRMSVFYRHTSARSTAALRLRFSITTLPTQAQLSTVFVAKQDRLSHTNQGCFFIIDSNRPPLSVPVASAYWIVCPDNHLTYTSYVCLNHAASRSPIICNTCTRMIRQSTAMHAIPQWERR